MALVIVESPNKCPKLKKILGSGYTVMASVGHIMDLEKKKMGIDTDTWNTRYQVTPGKKDVVKGLKAAAKNHTDIYIATDADREGEAIGFNLREILPKTGKNVYRVIFKTITKKDVLHAIKNPIKFNDDLFASQQARRITDRLVGFKVSPIMWTKGLKKTSAGRVQSAALKFIVDREMEIRSFVKEEFWTIKALTDLDFEVDFYGINGKKYVPKTKKKTDEILADFTKKIEVVSYTKKKRNRSPYPPYITASLQKDAGNRFGWTGKKVMDVAQNLFSQGLITYHRTDSVRSEPSKIIDIRSKIEAAHGKTYLSPQIRKYASNGSAQDAHEAIRPTFDTKPASMQSDQRKLLELITNRFMSSQMADAIFNQAAIKLKVVGKKNEYEFRASGSIKQFDGFLKVYGASTKDNALPPLKNGQKIGVKKYTPTQGFTKPPARYTDPGSFTDKMEKEGIGRPATYAGTMETLIRRNYVDRDKQKIKATEIGIMVSDYLTYYFKNVTSSAFTAQMESELDEIADGKRKLEPTMTTFFDKLNSEIDAAKIATHQIFKTDTDCTVCKDGSKMVKKISDLGVFLGCEKWPACGHTINFDSDGNQVAEEVETGHPCPVCSNMLEKRKGPYGEYYRCKGSACSFIGKDKNGVITASGKSAATDMGIKCPKCKKGDLLKRDGKFGLWAGCSEYRNGCKYSASIDESGAIVEKKKFTKKAGAPGKDTGIKCPSCGKGSLVERPSKFGSGTWTSCNAFPKCKYKK
jgi:DNA topoisomerase-1